MGIEIFQEKNKDDLIVGFMTFLSNELTYKIQKFLQIEKEEYKIKVDELLSTLRVDYRFGMRVGYDIISEKGHYGAKYFIKSKSYDCGKEKFFNILKMVEKTGETSNTFLNETLNN